MWDVPEGFHLPKVPVALAERYGASELRLRPFGAAPGDVEVDLRSTDRPRVVTEVLRRCTREGDGAEVPEALFWSLPVGARTRALTLLCTVSGIDALERTLVCPAAGCNEAVALGLALGDLAAAGTETADGAVVEHDERSIPLRLPTGDDLRRWAAAPPSAAGMLADLADPPLDPEGVAPELVAAAEEALSAADPLVDVRVVAACPACGLELEAALDLEGEALRALDRLQEGLLSEVARLAGSFHWSEPEVLALPAWRRRRYLELLAEEPT